MDFKEHTRLPPHTGLGTFEVVPPGGEINTPRLTESYSQKVDTRAAMLGIDRRALINDDLGVFDRVPRASAAWPPSPSRKQCTALLLAQWPHFTAGRKNLLTGAGSALADAGLSDAWQKAREATDLNGDAILATPTVLLVPPKLETTGRKLNQSTAVVSGSTTAIPDSNPWAGMFNVVTSPYLGASTAPSGTTGSDTAWFLFLPPGDFAVMEVAFLNGQRFPTVEQYESDPNMLGMGWRGWLDFGVAMLEYRGNIRNAGA
jgi:hypothetical protein